MQCRTSLSISDVLAARTDLLLMGKTSSGVVRTNTKSNINNMVIVGKVTDKITRVLNYRFWPSKGSFCFADRQAIVLYLLRDYKCVGCGSGMGVFYNFQRIPLL